MTEDTRTKNDEYTRLAGDIARLVARHVPGSDYYPGWSVFDDDLEDRLVELLKKQDKGSLVVEPDHLDLDIKCMAHLCSEETCNSRRYVEMVLSVTVEREAGLKAFDWFNDNDAWIDSESWLVKFERRKKDG